MPFQWVVPHKFYKLTSVKVYADYYYQTAFELTYSPDPAVTSGWPDITSPMFGFNDMALPSLSIALSDEIIELTACLDIGLIVDDLERFKFKQEGGSVEEIGSGDY